MDDILPSGLIDAVAEGDEALDRGERGPGRELRLLCEAGLFARLLPEAFGGDGWGCSPAGAVNLEQVLMALGGASLPVARIYEGHANAVELIFAHGDTSQKMRIAKAIHDGAILGVWGADDGIPVILDDKSGELSGAKAFASGLGDVSIAIVTAKRKSGDQMILVEAGDVSRADHSGWDVVAMRGSRSGRFDAGGLVVGKHDILGGPDAMFAEPAFHGGLWRLLACYAGAMRRIATELQDFVGNGGSTSGDLVVHRLAQVIMEAETARLWARHARATTTALNADTSDVSAVLLAREAIEAAAMRQSMIVERMVGTAMFRGKSAIGRTVRDLKLYLCQAQRDDKLHYAMQLWPGFR